MKNKIIIGIVIAILVSAIIVEGYFIVRNISNLSKEEVKNETMNSSNSESQEEVKNETINSSNSESQKEENEIISDKVLYTYSSGDNAAMHGNPEKLYIYKMDENVIDFKYHTPWSTEDIKGTARKTDSKTYTYVNGDYKIELLLYSMGENSIKVTEYENDIVSSWKNLWKDADANVNKNEKVTDNSTENTTANTKLNVNGSYEYKDETDDYYHISNIVIKNQTDTSINFSISAAHGSDVDHVNIGEVSGIANKVDIPADSVLPDSEQIAYQYTENIDGNINKITLICTAYRIFQYIDVKEEYPGGTNPYAGNRVYFSGNYEKID